QAEEGRRRGDEERRRQGERRVSSPPCLLVSFPLRQTVRGMPAPLAPPPGPAAADRQSALTCRGTAVRLAWHSVVTRVRDRGGYGGPRGPCGTKPVCHPACLDTI